MVLNVPRSCRIFRPARSGGVYRQIGGRVEMVVRSAALLAGFVIACAASTSALAQYYPPGPVYPPRPIGPPVFADDGVPPGYILGEERVQALPLPPGLRAPDDRSDLMRQGPYGPPATEVY